MKTLIGSKRRNAAELKKQFLECFGIRATNATTLRDTVKNLIERGVARKTLVRWAVQAGYTKSYVSSLLSRILCSIGLRERSIGAGRKPSPEALELLAYTRARYGNNSSKVLRAALRAGRAEVVSGNSRAALSLIVAPQLNIRQNNRRSSIRHEGKQLHPEGRLGQRMSNLRRKIEK